jgi:hypothetical protein
MFGFVNPEYCKAIGQLQLEDFLDVEALNYHNVYGGFVVLCKKVLATAKLHLASLFNSCFLGLIGSEKSSLYISCC